jgi:hypothetical protein
MTNFDWRRLRDPNQENGINRQWRTDLTALVMADDELREAGRRVCMNNLLGLSYVLGYCLIDEDVHREAIAFFPKHDPEKTVSDLGKGLKRRRSLLYPRNTFKSTLNIAFCVQLILCYFTTISILILSGSKELSYAFVDQVASFFIRNGRSVTLFQALFPELCVDRWRNSGWFTAAIRQSEPEIIEPLIWANSVDSATTGWHPDAFICDDVNNNRNSRKYTSRARLTKEYKMVRKVLKPTGIEIKIGTCYGPGDIFNDELLTARPGSYERVIKPAMRLKSGERLDANGFPDENDVELLMPSILSYEMLREEYESDYESFMSQYMMDNYGASEIVFDEREMLQAIMHEDRIPLEGRYHIAFRFPCLSRKWGTLSGAVGIEHLNRIFIVQIIQGHYKPSVMAKIIHETARRYGLHRITAEESPGARSYQSAIENYALTTGWPLSIRWIPFEEDESVRDTEIRNLEALIATGRLYFSAAVKTKPLITGFVEYGMQAETGLPDVVRHITSNLPISIAATDQEDDDAWRMQRERDHFNMVYQRGPYAPAEPEPEEIAEEEPSIEDQLYMENGLEILIPGLER